MKNAKLLAKVASKLQELDETYEVIETARKRIEKLNQEIRERDAEIESLEGTIARNNEKHDSELSSYKRLWIENRDRANEAENKLAIAEANWGELEKITGTVANVPGGFDMLEEFGKNIAIDSLGNIIDDILRFAFSGNRREMYRKISALGIPSGKAEKVIKQSWVDVEITKAGKRARQKNRRKQ